jgi:hypothetical protein
MAVRPSIFAPGFALALALVACSSSGVADDSAPPTTDEIAATSQSAPAAASLVPLRDDTGSAEATETSVAPPSGTAEETQDAPMSSGSGAATGDGGDSTGSAPGPSGAAHSVVIDDRPPTADLDLDSVEDDTTRNGNGDIVTLDEAGSLACAAAEKVLTALDEGDDPLAAVEDLLGWVAQTDNEPVQAAAAGLDDPVTFDGILPVLEACVTEGHEL